MASGKDTTSDSEENSDLCAVQHLVHSVGHLKFSLRTLASMQLQAAFHSQKATEPSSHLSPLESNRVLENIIKEVLSSKSTQKDENLTACEADETQRCISPEDLEVIQKKLQEEFEKRKFNFVTTMSSRVNE